MFDDIFSFEKLQVWQQSKAFVVCIYAVIAKFPDYERYALSTQVRRAVTSIPFNLAEGSGRISYIIRKRSVSWNMPMRL